MAKKRNWVWTSVPSKIKFTQEEKSRIIEQVKKCIVQNEKLSQKVSRIDIRGNRLYLYELVEQFIVEGVMYIKPLIDGKYLEFPYARITFLDKQGQNCTADWQRHNNQWFSLHDGTLTECLEYIEKDETWFS